MRQGQGTTSSAIRGWRSVEVVTGSGLLWAWGFLCYLSPVLIPSPDAEVSVGLEFGFFASQGAVVATALALIFLSHRRTPTLGPMALIAAAVAMSIVTLAIPWALKSNLTGLVIGLGAVSGIAGTLCGAAWGARYSLNYRHAPGAIVLSFLFAYGLYLALSLLPSGLGATVVVAALPVVSMGLHTEDAARRHGLTADVFPDRKMPGAKHPDEKMPGEILAGAWETRLLPWRALGTIIVATFIGNFVSSAIMGTTYRGAESLFRGGMLVCACIAFAALVPLTSTQGARSVRALYRITVTFTVAGLLLMLALGPDGMPMGGALVQGCAMFFQAIVYVLITQSTQREGLAPLLSFSVGQAVISAVVLGGNVLGKQLYALGGDASVPFNIACALCVLALFLMMVNAANEKSRDGEGATALDEESAEESAGGTETPEVAAVSNLTASPAAAMSEREAAHSERLGVFTGAHGLTKREAEVLGYLVRGRSLPYIADALFVTTGTVKTHVKHIYRKCSVNTRQELLDLVEETTP